MLSLIFLIRLREFILSVIISFGKFVGPRYPPKRVSNSLTKPNRHYLAIKELVVLKFSIQKAVGSYRTMKILIRFKYRVGVLVKVDRLLLPIMSPFMTKLGPSPLGQCTSRGGSGQQNMPIALGVCLASCPR